jgi:hypothetical protein
MEKIGFGLKNNSERDGCPEQKKIRDGPKNNSGQDVSQEKIWTLLSHRKKSTNHSKMCKKKSIFFFLEKKKEDSALVPCDFFSFPENSALWILFGARLSFIWLLYLSLEMMSDDWFFRKKKGN